MTNGISRRGLLRAFRNAGDPKVATNEPVVLFARITEACVEPKGITCRRCGDECEARAISFRPALAGRTRVLINDEACTGCGVCVPVCPANAIVLVSAERAALIAGLVDLGAI